MPNRYKPNARESTLLFLRLIDAREGWTKKAMTRVRLSELTLKRLWNRQRLTDQFLAEVQEWFLTAGWALVYAGNTYAAVKVDAVQNWPRVSSKRINNEIDAVKNGAFNFEKLEQFFRGSRDSQTDDEDLFAEEQ
jgi:hypothetical protein